MRLLLMLLLLAGCAPSPSDEALQPGSVSMRLNGRYDASAGVLRTH